MIYAFAGEAMSAIGPILANRLMPMSFLPCFGEKSVVLPSRHAHTLLEHFPQFRLDQIATRFIEISEAGNIKGGFVWNERLLSEYLLLHVVHVVVVLHERHVTFALIETSFKQLKVAQPVPPAAPFRPILGSNARRPTLRKSVIWMEVVLVILEIGLNPSAIKEVECLTGNPASFFSI